MPRCLAGADEPIVEHGAYQTRRARKLLESFDRKRDSPVLELVTAVDKLRITCSRRSGAPRLAAHLRCGCRERRQFHQVSRLRTWLFARIFRPCATSISRDCPDWASVSPASS